VTQQPDNVAALNNLAYLHSEQLPDMQKAWTYARRARELLPNAPVTADTLGWVHFKRGEYAEALRLLLEAAEKMPALEALHDAVDGSGDASSRLRALWALHLTGRILPEDAARWFRDPEPQSAPSATGLAVRSLSGAKARANGALAGNKSHRLARIKRALEDA
jgi:tetratricopeptide (TPR) repeat protein